MRKDIEDKKLNINPPGPIFKKKNDSRICIQSQMIWLVETQKLLFGTSNNMENWALF